MVSLPPVARCWKVCTSVGRLRVSMNRGSTAEFSMAVGPTYGQGAGHEHFLRAKLRTSKGHSMVWCGAQSSWHRHVLDSDSGLDVKLLGWKS